MCLRMREDIHFHKCSIIYLCQQLLQNVSLYSIGSMCAAAAVCINFCIHIVSSTQGCNGLFTFGLQSNNFTRSSASPPLPFAQIQHISMIIYCIVQQRLEKQLAMKCRRLECVSVTNFMNLKEMERERRKENEFDNFHYLDNWISIVHRLRKSIFVQWNEHVPLRCCCSRRRTDW